jgi:tripartite-type tricarboxylate transporter receptor subunit TctC
MRRLKHLLSFAVRVAALMLLGAVAAHAWPTKPVRIVVAYPTGGISDAVVRLMAEKLGPALGQPIVVENRAGAGGSIGMDAVAKATDGHTFGFASVSPLTLNPHVMKVPYDPLKDVVPVANVMYSPVYVLATPAFTGKSFADVLAQAREHPGKLNLATAGVATVGHVMLEQIKRQAKVDINHVPYKGGGQVITDAAGGHFELFTANPSPGVNGLVAKSTLRVLAVAAPQRLPAFPNAPTLTELGLPAANLTSVFGYFAPAKTPPEVIRRLNAEINRILGDKDVQERLAKLDNVVSSGTPEQFAALIRAEYDANAKVVKEAGIRVD